MGKLTVTPNGALLTESGTVVSEGVAGTWSVVVRPDNYLVRLPDAQASPRLVDIPRRASLLFSLIAAQLEDELVLTWAMLGHQCPGKENQLPFEVLKLVRDLHLGTLQRSHVVKLSGGEQVRLAVALALMSKPVVLVVHDLFDALDVQYRPVLAAALQQAVSRGLRLVELRSCMPEQDEELRGELVFVEEGKVQSWQPPWNRTELPLPAAYPPAPARPHTLHPLLRVTNLEHEYPGGFRLEVPSFHVSLGESVALTGPNGAGKTTLLLCLAHLLEPKRGEFSLTVAGATLVFGYPRRRPRVFQHVLCQFQNPDEQIYCRTVREELLETQRHARCAAPRAVEEVAADLGLSDVLEDSPWDLTLSRRRLVTLGSLLCANPPLILLDEPTAQLDTVQKARVLACLRAFVLRGGACVFISHDASFGAALAMRQHRLEGGSASNSTPLPAARQRPKFRDCSETSPPRS